MSRAILLFPQNFAKGFYNLHQEKVYPKTCTIKLIVLIHQLQCTFIFDYYNDHISKPLTGPGFCSTSFDINNLSLLVFTSFSTSNSIRTKYIPSLPQSKPMVISWNKLRHKDGGYMKNTPTKQYLHLK